MARDNKRDKHQTQQRMVKAKACPFCKEGVEGIDYKDVTLLRKFISDRGKIRARRVTGTCTQSQDDSTHTALGGGEDLVDEESFARFCQGAHCLFSRQTELDAQRTPSL